MKFNVSMKLKTGSKLTLSEVLAHLEPIRSECTRLEATMVDYSLGHLQAEYTAIQDDKKQDE